ncbi:cytochrome P450 [Hypoxylon sp. FL1857]|nr:cytochrome P450 [Hypoxylon sp. FL1857]
MIKILSVWFLVILFGTLLYCTVRLLLTARHAVYPGPIQGRLSPLYRAWLLLDGNGPIHYANLHKKYGPVVQTGPNHYSISDPAVISTIYDSKNQFLKSKFYNVFRLFYRGRSLESVLTAEHPEPVKHLKNILIKNLAGCAHLFEDEVNDSVSLFMKQMRERQGQSIDMSYWSFYWSFDLTFALLFGRHYGFMASGTDCNEWVYKSKNITDYAVLLGQRPEWCSWTLASNKFMTFIRRFQLLPDPTESLVKEIENQIREHDAKNHRCGKSLICKVLSERPAKDIGSPQHIEAVNIIFEAFFAAAAEIAVALTTVIYCLMRNPLTYERLVSQLRDDTNDGSSEKAGVADNQLLTSVIKESLRLYPINPNPMERVVPSNGFETHGHFLPPGSIVSVPHYSTHRDTSIYGDDAEEFRAERWLEGDLSAIEQMDQNFLTFGKGTRACIGRSLAMLEIRTFLTVILENFDIELETPKRLPKITMYWMLDYIGFNVRFRQRNI